MSWYAIGAIDRALSRTREALLEPFDFWKWVKLAIIIFLLGGVSSYGNSSSYNIGSEDLKNNFPILEPGKMPNLPFGMHDTAFGYIYQVPNLATIVAIIASLILLIFIFSYISNIMEFVFVESLVRNEVKFWSYSRRFLGKGFRLLLVRLAIWLVFLALFGISLLPLIPLIHEVPSDFSLPASLGGILWVVCVIIVLILLALAIESLLSLAIPLAIYRNKGILSAFKLVLGNFRKSWREVAVYWFFRLLLYIGIAVLAIFLFVIVALVLGLAFLIFDVALYFLFSSLLSELLLWLLLLPFIAIELILILGILLFLSVPLSVFLKYHLLSFLEAWYEDAEIPFFDVPVLEPETGVNEPEPTF
ncbi:hypothetical protein MSBRW_1640 [Methanosarcina barkeri str. Wiesmoor]|uniref:Glycerophosphoryl diester phosphodiesterase membrane domain-containing protein n=2 Tax=Methanosarcina barkeri TaxID=2208 RepID=A0A0E3QLP3_METBA|nr:hypothetical protein [Methanosarcina barkeri]AKB50893.1 hypothetical protein MSBRW_1640 [Methanosarcina barkeri str. Wiesmoor]